MISPKIIKAKGFWKSIVRVSLTLILLMLLLRIMFAYELDFSRFVETELSPNNIFMFFVSNILVWVVVGFVISYFNFKKKIKEDNTR